MAVKSVADGDSPYTRISKALAGDLAGVFRCVVVRSDDFERLTLYQRGGGDILAVLKRMNSDGAPEVCFGNGFDVVSALLGLEGSLKAGKWRLDKPAPGKK